MDSLNQVKLDVDGLTAPAVTFPFGILSSDVDGKLLWNGVAAEVICACAAGSTIHLGMPTYLTNESIYDLGILEGETDLSAIRFTGNAGTAQTAEIWFTTDTIIHNIIWPSNIIWHGAEDGLMPPLLSNTNYRIKLRKEAFTIIAFIDYYYANVVPEVDADSLEDLLNDGEWTIENIVEK